MMRNAVTFTALAALSLVSAQDSNSNSTWHLDNPAEVPLGTRSSWCNAQDAACDNLCVSIKSRTCDPDTLDFSCVCSNDESPDFNDFKDTIPFFVCKQLFQDCIESHPNDATGQRNCTSTYDDKCGTEAPVNGTKIDASPSASATPSETSQPASTSTGSGSGSGGAEETSTPDSGAMPMNMPIQHIGNVVAALAAGLFAYML